MSTFTKPFAMASLSIAFAFCVSVSAQTQMNGEFIESSSPTRNGGNVTTRAEPGRRIQTTITLPRNASPRVASISQRQQVPTTVNRGSNSVLETSSAGSTISGQPQPNQNASTNNSVDRYPYPAQYSPRVAANPFQPNPNANRVNASRPQLQNNNCNCAPVPVNGLGLTPVPTFNSQTGGRLIPTAGYQGTGGGALVGQGVQPVLSQAPQLQYQIPGQAPVGTQQFGGGQIGVPQFATQQPNWAQSPWLTGTPGAYRPLVGVFNMPQGAFLGQGIIGQPEAYVNGQPIANFFRYMFPF